MVLNLMVEDHMNLHGVSGLNICYPTVSDNLQDYDPAIWLGCPLELI